MLVNVYNQAGEKQKQVELPKSVFEIDIKEDLIHQVVVSMASNRRQGTAHAKDRGEVRGGGKKPWRQKGTGRARHGSSRSPIWKGGGVTFGPRNEKVYKKIIPKKMKRKALGMALSSKATEGMLIVIDSIKLSQAKTKLMSVILEKLPCYGKSTLIALPDMDKNIIIASRNIPNVTTIQAKDLNAMDILNFQYLVISKESIKVIEGIFKGEKVEKKEDKVEKKNEEKEIKKEVGKKAK